MSWAAADVRDLDPHAVHRAEPDGVADLGRDLGGVADNLELVAGLLGQVSTHGVWESPSGETFAAAVGDVPVTLRRLAGRLGDAGELVARYAGTLRTHQEDLARTAEAHARESETVDEIDRQLAVWSPHPEEPALLARRGDAIATVVRHERDYVGQASDAWADEQLLAADLYAVGLDLTDPSGYDLAEGVRDLGRSSLFTGPVSAVVKPLAVGSALDPVGQGALRLAYGQGSWRDIGRSSATHVADAVIKGSGRYVHRATGTAPRPRSRLHDVLDRPGAHAPVPATTAWGRVKQTSNRWRLHGAALGREQTRRTLRRESGLELAEQIVGDWEAVAGASRRVVAVQAVGSTARVAKRSATTFGRARDGGQRLGELRGATENQERSTRRADVS